MISDEYKNKKEPERDLEPWIKAGYASNEEWQRSKIKSQPIGKQPIGDNNRRGIDYSRSGKEIEGSTFPIIFPIKTTAQRNALSKGKLRAGFSIFNSDLKRAEIWTGTTWVTLVGTSTSSSSSSSSSSSISTSTTII